MLLIVFIFFVKIEFLSCIFENKDQQDFLEQINRERNNLGLRDFQIHLTLQLAAEKRCTNREELIQTYQKLASKSYRNDEWAKQELLNKIFPIVGETIYLNGPAIANDVLDHSLLIPNLYRTDFLYIGIADNEHRNFSARCILYGSSNNSISNHYRLLRLLYILIACGILLLALILCSILNDRRRARVKQDLEQEVMQNTQTIIPHKSIIDRRSVPASRRTELNRITMARLGPTMDERFSAVHNFFQSPK